MMQQLRKLFLGKRSFPAKLIDKPSHILPPLFFRVNRFRRHAGEHTELSRKRADNVRRCVYHDADDVDILLPVWNAHPADDIIAEVGKQLVHLADALLTLHQYAD